MPYSLFIDPLAFGYNRFLSLFDSALIRRIIKNPVYCGKIAYAYGHRKTENVYGTRNEYRLVEQDDYLVVDGLHEGIVSEEFWNQAQVKMIAQAKKYEHVNKAKDTKTHLLSGLVQCPICGAGIYGNKSIKHRKDGSKYKDFYYMTGITAVVSLTPMIVCIGCMTRSMILSRASSRPGRRSSP